MNGQISNKIRTIAYLVLDLSLTCPDCLTCLVLFDLKSAQSLLQLSF